VAAQVEAKLQRLVCADEPFKLKQLDLVADVLDCEHLMITLNSQITLSQNQNQEYAVSHVVVDRARVVR
jgi:hypothetical protein